VCVCVCVLTSGGSPALDCELVLRCESGWAGVSAREGGVILHDRCRAVAVSRVLALDLHQMEIADFCFCACDVFAYGRMEGRRVRVYVCVRVRHCVGGTGGEEGVSRALRVRQQASEQ